MQLAEAQDFCGAGVSLAILKRSQAGKAAGETPAPQDQYPVVAQINCSSPIEFVSRKARYCLDL
jgi:hypothetical protein